MISQFSDRLQDHLDEMDSIINRMWINDEGFLPLTKLVGLSDKLRILVMDMRDQEGKE